jgi:replicative DNA helicase
MKLPHSPEDELGVLGSCLLDCSLIPKIDLQPKDFYDPRHEKLWNSLQQQYNEGKAMDAITIGAWLKSNDMLYQVGGYDHLVRLQSDVLVPAHSQYYAEGVRKASKLRQEIAVLQDGLGVAYSGESVSERVISALNLSALGTNKDTPLDELGEQFIQDCIDGNVGHFNWWCDEWTQHLGKMSSELMILHAPRSTGKTAIMLQWIVNAHRNEMRTPLASIEMLKPELMPRLIAHAGQVNTYTMRTRGFATDSEIGRSRSAIKEIKVLELCVRDKGMSIEDIRGWAIAEARNGADAIFIDNLLSINDGGKKFDSKTLMYDHFIRKLRDLRDELAIPIIILAHPNQNNEVAWSKDVENFADVILFLMNVPYEGMQVNGKNLEYKGDGHVVARFQKNRQGISPTASLHFNKEYQTFEHREWH